MWDNSIETQINIKKLTFSQSMRRKETKFWRKKIKTSGFCINKKVLKIDEIDVDETLVSKKEPMVQISQLNISLDTMMMMLLDHYV